MGGTIQEFALDEPRPANVAEIEAGLSAMWRSAAEASGSESAVTRASALTLLVYVDREESAREVSNMLAEVTRQNPCRAVLMVMDPKGTPPGLTATLSAHCHRAESAEKQICSEQITLNARGEMGPELISVVLPLTVSGLPIYLWWRAESFAMPAYFDQILRMTEHVIVDSASFAATGADLRALAAWLEKHSGRIRLSDLNWARATPWREVMAQSFDSPDRRPYLHHISSVRIEYEMESARLTAQRAQSLLLTAWLATRLGWEFRRTESHGENQPRSFFFQSGDREIKVERVLRKVEGGCGVCFSFEIEAEGAHFSFSRGTDGKVVQTRAEVPGQPPIGRTVRIEAENEVEILNDELMVSGRDHVYEEALALVARMTRY
ncbi:MAG: glucose-6-phosphate dehydrogenase assembly protein OpcA [Acidobacteriota bacterium]|nr:glucose-6-phosphate dehydrogenase assembly protein OpcA [Acidobacteriota bacterium]